MDIVLTPKLLHFLVKHGYKYCLSKTTQQKSDFGKIRITLKPVCKPPFAIRLPEGFSNYHLTNQEPARLANGVEGVITVMRLDTKVLLAYIYSVTLPANRRAVDA